MAKSYSITSKYQVTIPKQIRDQLKLTGKDKVYFSRRGRDIILKKASSLEEVAKMMQADLKRRGFNKTVSDEEMKQARDIFYKQGGKW